MICKLGWVALAFGFFAQGQSGTQNGLCVGNNPKTKSGCQLLAQLLKSDSCIKPELQKFEASSPSRLSSVIQLPSSCVGLPSNSERRAAFMQNFFAAIIQQESNWNPGAIFKTSNDSQVGLYGVSVMAMSALGKPRVPNPTYACACKVTATGGLPSALTASDLQNVNTNLRCGTYALLVDLNTKGAGQAVHPFSGPILKNIQSQLASYCQSMGGSSSAGVTPPPDGSTGAMP